MTYVHHPPCFTSWTLVQQCKAGVFSWIDNHLLRSRRPALSPDCDSQNFVFSCYNSFKLMAEGWKIGNCQGMPVKEFHLQ